jgi:hypothetical protein
VAWLGSLCARRGPMAQIAVFLFPVLILVHAP